ncbi:MAG: hypothetical protein AAFU34_14030 [Pseudomonadota bacterium]
MFETADRWLASPALRLALVAAYLIAAALVALFFPDTPDELSRISIARRYLETGRYDFFWPPGNVWVIILNPLIELMDDVTAVRLFNLALAGMPLGLLFFTVRDARLVAIAALVAPYTYFALSTGSQQGLMIGLLLILLWTVKTERLVPFWLTAVLLYLVNPALILMLPLGLFFLAVRRGWRTTFMVAVLAYLPIAATALWIWSDNGRIMPTLSGNGGYNVFLGNNPDPMSPRGVGDREAARTQYGAGNEIQVTLEFLRTDPTGFAANMAKKAWLYWMPWDFLRSGMGEGVTTILFAYFAVAQIAIYTTLWVWRKDVDPRLFAFVIATCLAAWAVYTLFFVKLRFRIPFDLILFFAVLMSPAARKRAAP